MDVQDGASRRNVLKSGALGVGALATVMGVGGVAETSADAAVPRLSAASGGTVDLFLKVDGIDGESTDRDHRGEIPLLAFAWGAANSGAGSASSGAGAGKVMFRDLNFTAVASKASPSLFRACATGKHIKQATLSVRRRGKGATNYIKLVLTDVFVSSYTSGSSDTSPLDTVGLSFGGVTYMVNGVSAEG